jgi:hypothetical protein
MTDSVRLTTPKGKLLWVNIVGQGMLNFNENGNNYTASIVLSREDSKDLRESIKSHYMEEKQKGNTFVSNGYKPCDEDGVAIDSDSSDYFIFNFKTNTVYPDGTQTVIDVYNSSAKKVELGDTRIGNGSIGAIGGSMRYYSVKKKDGVSLFLNNVQIISLVEYAESSGFEASEGGFTGVEDPATGFTPQHENKMTETAVKTRL